MANGELPERGDIAPQIAALPLIGPTPILDAEAASAAFFEARERDPQLAHMLEQLSQEAGPIISRMSEAELRSRGRNPAESTERERWQVFIKSAAQLLIGQTLHAYGDALQSVREVETLFGLPTVDEPRGGAEGQQPAA